MTFMLSALGMAYVDKMNKHRDFSKSLAFGVTVFVLIAGPDLCGPSLPPCLSHRYLSNPAVLVAVIAIS